MTNGIKLAGYEPKRLFMTARELTQVKTLRLQSV
jgi:hypothetical protein